VLIVFLALRPISRRAEFKGGYFQTRFAQSSSQRSCTVKTLNHCSEAWLKFGLIRTIWVGSFSPRILVATDLLTGNDHSYVEYWETPRWCF
jgi:hypothetical protein